MLPTITNEDITYQLAHIHESRQPSMIASICVLYGVTVIVVVLRFVSRRIQGLRLGWDDYTIVLGTIMTASMCGVLLEAVRLGLGRHIITVGRDKGIQIAKLLYVFEVLFPVPLLFSKLAILFLYNTLFGSKSNRKFVTMIRFLAGLWISLTIVGIFCISLQCWPVRLAWTSDHAENCLDLEKLILTLTVYASFLNVATLAVPLTLVWKLKLSTRKKIGVGILFVLGGGDLAVCIGRAVIVRFISATAVDFTWLQVDNAVLAVTEVNIGIICACIPTLRPVFIRIFSSFRSIKRPAEVGGSAWTVPFVMLFSRKTPTGRGSGHVGILNTPTYEAEKHWQDKTRSIYSQRSVRKCGRTKSEAKWAMHTQSPTLTNVSADWKGSIYVSHGECSDYPAPLAPKKAHKEHKQPRASIKSMIGQHLVHSGYPSEVYCKLKEPQKRPDEPPPPLPPLTSPITTHQNMAFMSRMSGLSVDTSPAMIRPPTRNPSHPVSPRTNESSPTLIGSANSPEKPTGKGSIIRTPTTSLAAAIEKGQKPPQGLRRPGQRSLSASGSASGLASDTPYRPPAPGPTSRGSKSPKYVRSPLMDPQNKVRIGSPKMVAIKTPTRGRSVSKKSNASHGGYMVEERPQVPQRIPLESHTHPAPQIIRPARATGRDKHEKPLPEPPPWWEDGGRPKR